MVYILLYLIGRALSMNVWYWMLWAIAVYTKLCIFIVKFVKQGRDEE